MRTKQHIEAFFRRNTSHATGTAAVSALSVFGDFRSLNFLWMQEVPFMNFKGSLVDSGFYILPFSHFILLYINLLYWFHRKLHSLVTVYCSLSSVDCILCCLLCSFFVLFAHLVGVAKGLACFADRLRSFFFYCKCTSLNFRLCLCMDMNSIFFQFFTSSNQLIMLTHLFFQIWAVSNSYPWVLCTEVFANYYF